MMTLMAAVFAITLVLGFPVAFCLGITSVAVLLATDVPLNLVAQRIFTGMDSFPLMAVPFFVLAGEIMNVGGTTQRLISLAHTLVGKIRGGLAHTTVVSAMFLSGISGSAVADASALGSVLIPGMVQKGYGRGFSAAITASAAVMGPTIPPSILMVILGVTTGLSIGALFAAGLVPGVLQGLAMMAMAYYYAVKNNYPKDEEPLTLKRLWKETMGAGPALFAPVIIIGGILAGAFTPTEAAVVAVFYALILGMWVYRELTWKDLWNVLVNTGVTTSVLLLIIGMANIFAWVLTAEQVPQKIANMLLGISKNPHVVLLMINLVLLIVGMFMEAGAAIVILSPTLLAVAQAVGIHPLHFGFVMILNLSIGLITPPVGVLLFVVCGITGYPFSLVTRWAMPFTAANLATLALVSYFPALIMWVPKLFGYV
jgi:tripartite ATP-independent transporter DctM subunit